MAKTQNLTVRLDEAVIRKAKILAAERGTSISQIVAETISEAVDDAHAYAEVRRRALALLDRGFPMGPPRRASRDELHARR